VLKLRARALGVAKIDAGAQGGYVLFNEGNAIDPQTVIRLVQSQPRTYRLDGPLKLRFVWRSESEAERLRQAGELLDTLAAAAPGTTQPASRTASR
jgi:transcription-repair coupling factor (superfamily II helicase)